MDCILLGTGGMMPLPDRLLSSLAVRLNGRTYLFDAGEGTQLGWKRAQLALRGFKLLAVTHLHADHCLGVPGLLMLRAQMDDPEPFTVLGPPGIRSFLEETRKGLGFYLNYPIHFIEWSETSESLAYEDDQVRILWQPLKHTRFCLGYRMEEHERPGRFNPGRAVQLGIRKGPLWGELQKGNEIILESGKAITPCQVLGPARSGRHLAYVVDTRPTKALYTLCRNVDIAFMEGMFLPEHAEHADIKGHMTVIEASRLARRAGVKQAILIHISPRYSGEDLQQIEDKAREAFETIKVGRDLDVYSVPYTDQ
ncbi:MAG TPA: ribonuclease Z [Syntrophobacteraceae bacterium]|nr:ribonuclease Z [Syntrophobacteraceae bacterium]